MSKIVILGAGPSSMLTALALAKNNISSKIFEKDELNKNYFYKDIRNFALTEFAVNFLKDLSIWEHLEQYAVPLKTVYIVDNKSPSILEFGPDLDVNSFGYMIKSSDFRAILFNLIQHNPLIEKNIGVTYKDVDFGEYYSSIILETGQRIEASLIIASDGKNSNLRKKYFHTSTFHDYRQTALVFNIKHEHPHNQSALEHFLPNGCFAILPLLDNNESSIVWSEDSVCASILSRMDKNEIMAHLFDRAGSSYGKIEIISEIFSYPLSASLSDKYYFKNIVLVADSAHTIHPLAGQGLNQGIKDVKSLTDLIYSNHKLGLPIDSVLLREYEKSRKLDNIKMFKITHYLDMIFSNNMPILSSSRKISLSIINAVKPLKKLIIKGAMM